MEKTTFCLLAMLVMLLMSCPSFADEYGAITSGQLKAKLDSKDDFVLIDARTAEEFGEAHIPGAININEKNFDCQVLDLPAKKSAQLVIYCNGVKCGKSAKLAARLKKHGYLNILLYREGLPVWEEQNLPMVTGPNHAKKIPTAVLTAQELGKIVAERDASYTIVDVREPGEYAEGHIPSAINIPLEQFASRSEVLSKDKKIVVYCNSGSRSYTAFRKLIQLAYPNRYQAIFADWKEAGLPVER